MATAEQDKWVEAFLAVPTGTGADGRLFFQYAGDAGEKTRGTAAGDDQSATAAPYGQSLMEEAGTAYGQTLDIDGAGTPEPSADAGTETYGAATYTTQASGYAADPAPTPARDPSPDPAPAASIPFEHKGTMADEAVADYAAMAKLGKRVNDLARKRASAAGRQAAEAQRIKGDYLAACQAALKPLQKAQAVYKPPHADAILLDDRRDALDDAIAAGKADMIGEPIMGTIDVNELETPTAVPDAARKKTYLAAVEEHNKAASEAQRLYKAFTQILFGADPLASEIDGLRAELKPASGDSKEMKRFKTDALTAVDTGAAVATARVGTLGAPSSSQRGRSTPRADAAAWDEEKEFAALAALDAEAQGRAHREQMSYNQAMNEKEKKSLRDQYVEGLKYLSVLNLDGLLEDLEPIRAEFRSYYPTDEEIAELVKGDEAKAAQFAKEKRPFAPEYNEDTLKTDARAGHAAVDKWIDEVRVAAEANRERVEKEDEALRGSLRASGPGQKDALAENKLIEEMQISLERMIASGEISQLRSLVDSADQQRAQFRSLLPPSPGNLKKIEKGSDSDEAYKKRKAVAEAVAEERSKVMTWLDDALRRAGAALTDAENEAGFNSAMPPQPTPREQLEAENPRRESVKVDKARGKLVELVATLNRDADLLDEYRIGRTEVMAEVRDGLRRAVTFVREQVAALEGASGGHRFTDAAKTFLAAATPVAAGREGLPEDYAAIAALMDEVRGKLIGLPDAEALDEGTGEMRPRRDWEMDLEQMRETVRLLEQLGQLRTPEHPALRQFSELATEEEHLVRERLEERRTALKEAEAELDNKFDFEAVLLIRQIDEALKAPISGFRTLDARKIEA